MLTAGGLVSVDCDNGGRSGVIISELGGGTVGGGGGGGGGGE